MKSEVLNLLDGSRVIVSRLSRLDAKADPASSFVLEVHRRHAVAKHTFDIFFVEMCAEDFRRFVIGAEALLKGNDEKP